MKSKKDIELYMKENEERVLLNLINNYGLDILNIPSIYQAALEHYRKLIDQILKEELETKMVFRIQIHKEVKTREEMVALLRKVAGLVEEGYDSEMKEAWYLSQEVPEYHKQE